MKPEDGCRLSRAQSTLRAGCAARLLFAMLGGAVGCGDELSVGDVDPDFADCPSGVPCAPPKIELPNDYVGLAARSSGVLAPVWSQTMSPNTYGARAGDGNLWLATVQGETIWVRRVDDRGAASQETTLAAPVAMPNTTVSPKVVSFSPHEKGPVLHVSWTHWVSHEVGCVGSSRATTAMGVSCASEFELLVLDGANLASPTRVDLCIGSGFCLPTGEVYRSGDGESLLSSRLQADGSTFTLVEQTLDGKVVSTSQIPWDFHALNGTAVGAHGWSLYGASSVAAGMPGGARGLIGFERGGKPSVTYLQGADASGGGTGTGVVLPGPGPGQTIAVVERLAGDTGLGGGSRLAGDLAVVRLEGGVLQGQQVLTRQEYASLPLTAVGVDDAGTVYVLTATGDRDATLNHTLTTLVCRLPVAAAGACFQLPTPDAPDGLSLPRKGIYALRENVLIVNTGTQLARVDLPL